MQCVGKDVSMNLIVSMSDVYPKIKQNHEDLCQGSMFLHWCIMLKWKISDFSVAY